MFWSTTVISRSYLLISYLTGIELCNLLAEQRVINISASQDTKSIITINRLGTGHCTSIRASVSQYASTSPEISTKARVA